MKMLDPLSSPSASAILRTGVFRFSVALGFQCSVSAALKPNTGLLVQCQCSAKKKLLVQCQCSAKAEHWASSAVLTLVQGLIQHYAVQSARIQDSEVIYREENKRG